MKNEIQAPAYVIKWKSSDGAIFRVGSRNRLKIPDRAARGDPAMRAGLFPERAPNNF